MSAGTVPSALTAKRLLALVVDADADTRELYRVGFEMRGYEVVDAADGRDALTKAFVRPPDVVVTETSLAHIDGFALCEILRRDSATMTIPIVVVTAESDPAREHRAKKAGASVVLTKPVPTDDIVAELRRVLDEHNGPDRGGAAPPVAGRPSMRASRSHTFRRSTNVSATVLNLALRCPSCDRLLIYERSHVGGVTARQAERWDDYSCPNCGSFQYRHRTRKLKRRPRT